MCKELKEGDKVRLKSLSEVYDSYSIGDGELCFPTVDLPEDYIKYLGSKLEEQYIISSVDEDGDVTIDGFKHIRWAKELIEKVEEMINYATSYCIITEEINQKILHDERFNYASEEEPNGIYYKFLTIGRTIIVFPKVSINKNGLTEIVLKNDEFVVRKETILSKHNFQEDENIVIYEEFDGKLFGRVKIEIEENIYAWFSESWLLTDGTAEFKLNNLTKIKPKLVFPIYKRNFLSREVFRFDDLTSGIWAHSENPGLENRNEDIEANYWEHVNYDSARGLYDGQPCFFRRNEERSIGYVCVSEDGIVTSVNVNYSLNYLMEEIEVIIPISIALLKEMPYVWEEKC